MLTPDEAKTLLEAHRLKDKDAEKRYLQAATQLDEALRPVAYGLMGRDADGKHLRSIGSPDYSAHWRRAQQAAAARLDALAPAERTQVFAVFFPALGDAMELTWHHLAARGYSEWGGMGTGRMPGRPDLTREARANWLVRLIGTVGQYNEDVCWLARHAGYLGYGSQGLSHLFAAVIDAGGAMGDAVFDILMRTARGEDEVAVMGEHVPQALLAAERPDGWECIERLLLAAQRDEGLRQSILMSARTAHPEAFRRLVHLIIAHDLARFSSVVQVVNSWLGTAWEAGPSAARTRTLAHLAALLDDPAARVAALAGSGEEAYLALWTMAHDDLFVAVRHATDLIADADVARRFAAARLLAAARVAEAAEPLLRALADTDPRVAARACLGLSQLSHYDGTWREETGALALPAAFERIEDVLAHLPRHAAPAQPLLWDLPAEGVEREQVAGLLLPALGDRDVQRLIPYLSEMSAQSRGHVAELLAADVAAHHGASASRAALLGLLGDRTGWVRERALKALSKMTLLPDDIPALEGLLTRKSEELRRAMLELLLKQSDSGVLASADRLLIARDEQQRRAGLDLLRLLVEAERVVPECSARIATYRQAREALGKGLSEAERVQLAAIARASGARHEVPTLDNALGLGDPAERTAPPAPAPRPHAWISPASIADLLALDELIHEHRADAYHLDDHLGNQEVLLGTNIWRFPPSDAKVPIAQDVARLPFAGLWRQWAEARGPELRDEDGLEFVRMLIQFERRGFNAARAFLAELGVVDGSNEAVRLTLRYSAILEKLCWWLVRLYPAASAPDFLLDQLETVLTEIPERELREPEAPGRVPGYREYHRLARAVALARSHRAFCGADWTDVHGARFWRLLRWSETLPQPHLRYRPHITETLVAYREGAASETDLVFQFLGPRPNQRYGAILFDELRTFSSRQPLALQTAYPITGEVFARTAQRVLEVELARGEMPTAATPAALSLRSVVGSATFVRLLQALGSDLFDRELRYGDRVTGKINTLSHLLRVSYPGADDTPEALGALVRAARIPERRLVEAAVYAPQWARLLELMLGWDGFAEAVWWIHAHTKDRHWSARDEWAARVSEWTPLTSDDLYDGAVDVAWFARMHARLGTARWDTLYQAAKYSTSGTGHTRAKLFADAMLGTLDEATLSARITAKRNRDAACALGLVPLPHRARERERATLARYQTLQAFIRTARTFGAQRREGDQKAARIGLENLARTAGYPDVQRFQWAMELREAGDLNEGAHTVTREEVTIRLRLDALGQPHLDVERAGRALKQIPPRLKKDPEVVRLRERVTALERQLARMRLGLEQAMCREELFPLDELCRLLGHPVVAPLLDQLVFVAAEGGAMGYLVAGGQALRSHDGSDQPLAPDVRLRIAHPHDLYQSGVWSQWQRECFTAERIQPFKQIFRELYPLTEMERHGGAVSLRYAGHQIQQRQAMALLAGRGWVASIEDGSVSRTFHDRKLTASVTFASGGWGTPAEVDGLALDGVVFHAAGDAWGKPLPLDAVPPIVFSEVMRDLDLVVSVAHRGGVDPESSASTVELRAALVREVAASLGLANVRLQASHALIAGTLGEYALHLGSGTVHRLPGGALCIVPVPSQHRGRLFLPFVDDDPKTAEVVSKAVLLARDSEIKDPVILQQLYARV